MEFQNDAIHGQCIKEQNNQGDLIITQMSRPGENRELLEISYTEWSFDVKQVDAAKHKCKKNVKTKSWKETN